MSVVFCPKCKSPNDDQMLSSGWLVCAICTNRWFPSAATIDSLPTTEIPTSRPATPKVSVQPLSGPASDKLKRAASGEYMPDEPSDGPSENRALTGRVDGRNSGVAPAIRDAVAPTRQPVSPASPAAPRGGRSTRPAVAHRPEDGPTIDSDLFDRLEQEAIYNRSEMKTVPEITYDDPEKYRTSVPHSDHSEKIICPVCGHSYASAGPHHICPQCGTSYDETSQRIASGPGEKDGLIGRTLRGCLIDRKLGEGGMGTVYHAKQLSLDRSVAIKVLPVDLARNKNFIQRFEREAKSLARINHPNILQIYDFGEDQQLGLYFMIIEFVEGLDLGEVLNRRGLLGQIEVLDLLRQSVAGLDAAAEKGVIHRDIKPDNLMIGSNGLVKVSDFGLAKGYVAQVGVTAAGVRVGTPAFMSPEQCDGADVDFRSDIYNLGATAFLCLTGQLPFDGETPFAIMLKHKTEAVPSLSRIDPGIDQQVDRLISRMLAKRPADRCSSLRELVEHIEELETALAATDSVLRKSRGPFKALMGGAPPMAIPPGRPQARPQLAPIEPVELADLPMPSSMTMAHVSPVASQSGGRKPTGPVVLAPPTLAPLSPAAKSSGSQRRAVETQNDPPPLELAAPPVADKAAARSSKRMDFELAQARERGRRSQLDLALANAQRLHEGGQLREAADAYLAASELATSDPGLQKDLARRAKSARRRAGFSRLVRRMVVGAGAAALVVGGVWAATPSVHNFIIAQRLKVLQDGLATIPQPRQKIAALREFAESNHQPWSWYESLFHREYSLLAAQTAANQADEIERQPPPPPPKPQLGALAPELQAVNELSQDANSPWEQVAQRANDFLKAARSQDRDAALIAPAVEVAKLAESELGAQRADLERIAKVRAAGDHAQALSLAMAFRTRHVRALPATLLRLPLPGRVRVEVTAYDIPADLTLSVDGVAVKGVPAAPGNSGMPAVEVGISRLADKDVTVEVSADGFGAARQVLAASPSPAEKRVDLQVRPATLWSVPFANPAINSTLVAWARVRPVNGGLVVQHHDGLLVLRQGDGAVSARLERATPNSPGYGALWIPQAGGRAIVAQDDGVVQLVATPSLVAEQALHRGKGEVLAWADLDLVLQNGRRIHAVVERGATQCDLIAQDAVREHWRYANLKVANQVPVLLHHDDRLYIFDDAGLHLLEEDGTVVRVFALPSPRIGPLAELPVPAPGRRDFLIPTAAGVQRIQLGTHQDPVRLLPDHALAQAGVGQVVSEGDSAVVVGDRFTTLVRFAGAGSLVWRQERPRPLGAMPTLSSAYVVTLDDQGQLTVRDRSTGQSLLRLLHGIPPTSPAVVMEVAGGPAVVFCDRVGQVVAYRIRR
jgi:serine/threonine-protein kinase